MHSTDTIDDAICLEGELCLWLDNEAEVTLTPGTCVLRAAPVTRGRTAARSRR
jgi:quercetin dioxygenase-like cupin family protein